MNQYIRWEECSKQRGNWNRQMWFRQSSAN